eukprot:1159635-Pelagomonas_calceolata.AAC.9
MTFPKRKGLEAGMGLWGRTRRELREGGRIGLDANDSHVAQQGLEEPLANSGRRSCKHVFMVPLVLAVFKAASCVESSRVLRVP